jgi:pimeloyl-ACP methyl ester carboxylesterase
MCSVSPGPTTPINRQAIVIIHGIGEQRPLGTLKSFVRSFRADSTFYSKPERMTSSFEARRIKLRRLDDGTDWIETDFYEYYWAHLMFGERWRHLLRWACTRIGHLFFTTDEPTPAPPSESPSANVEPAPHPQLESLRRRLIAVAIGITTLALLSVALFGMAAVFATLVVVLVLVVAGQWVSESSALRVIGDVSRYLDVSPVNIGRRHDILQGGIDLLSALHAERSDLDASLSVAPPTSATTPPPPYVYDRIVVVGHSLGSIIGYEIIKHYWARVNRYLAFDERSIPTSVTEVEAAVVTSEKHTDAFQDRQFAVWCDLGRSRDTKPQVPGTQAAPRWLITDFVTMGSPLTYAPILMAECAKDFNDRAALRELPLCPPNRSLRDRPNTFAVHLRFEAAVNDKDPTLILHHAAPFAATRWTNFFFRDDPIGGRLNNVFGYGVKDVLVTPSSLHLAPAWHRLFSGFHLHTRYWPAFPHHIPELFSILKGSSSNVARS